jgi:hypothetical protein
MTSSLPFRGPALAVERPEQTERAQTEGSPLTERAGW